MCTCTVLFWLVNLLPVAFLLAIFEIWLDEHHKEGPWGKTAFKNPYWEQKSGIPVPFIKYFTKYHTIMFLIVMPVLFIGSMIVWSYVLEYNMFPAGNPWYFNVVSFLTMFLAILVGNMGLEDFFYFLIQSVTGWHEPHALRRVVINKDFAWFKDWLPPIFGLNIPGHWVFNPIASLVLLWIHWMSLNGFRHLIPSHF